VQGDLHETLVWCTEHDSSNYSHNNLIDHVEDDTAANDDTVANNDSIAKDNLNDHVEDDTSANDSSNCGHDSSIDYVEDDPTADNDSVANNDCTTCCTSDDRTSSNEYYTACYQHTCTDNETRWQVRFKLQGWPIEDCTGM